MQTVATFLAPGDAKCLSRAMARCGLPTGFWLSGFFAPTLKPTFSGICFARCREEKKQATKSVLRRFWLWSFKPMELICFWWPAQNARNAAHYRSDHKSFNELYADHKVTDPASTFVRYQPSQQHFCLCFVRGPAAFSNLWRRVCKGEELGVTFYRPVQNLDCIDGLESRWMEQLPSGVMKLHREGHVRYAELSAEEVAALQAAGHRKEDAPLAKAGQAGIPNTPPHSQFMIATPVPSLLVASTLLRSAAPSTPDARVASLVSRRVRVLFLCVKQGPCPTKLCTPLRTLAFASFQITYVCSQGR